MFKQNLEVISSAAKILLDKVNEENLEDWAEDKISKCTENMRTLRDYYLHNKQKEGLSEHKDGDYMYKQNLEIISTAADILIKKVTEENLQDWAEDMISKVADNIRAVKDFYLHGQQPELEEGLGHSHAMGRGQNLKPGNYPQTLKRVGLKEGVDSDGETYLVTDCDFNRAHYGDLVGKTFADAPSYAKVKLVRPEDAENMKKLKFDDDGNVVKEEIQPEWMNEEEFDYAATEREHHGHEEVNALADEARQRVPENLQQYLVPGSFQTSETNDDGQVEYSYILKIPKQADETLQSIEEFIKEEEPYQNAAGPGQSYHKTSIHTVLEKATGKWVVEVNVRTGYDI